MIIFGPKYSNKFFHSLTGHVVKWGRFSLYPRFGHFLSFYGVRLLCVV